MPVRGFLLVLRRDLKVAFRRVSEWSLPLLFFIAVSAFFPLALSPDRLAMAAGESELYGLQSLGIGVIWMGTLLASLMGLDRLFLNDVEDGSLEQLVLSPVPLLSVVYGKLAAHWLVSALPLVILVPFVGLSYRLTPGATAMLALSLLIATPVLTVIVAIGAALTVNLRGATAIIGLLVLPLVSPALIFGARAAVLALDVESAAGPLYFNASLAILAVSLGPVAIAAALRAGLE